MSLLALIRVNLMTHFTFEFDIGKLLNDLGWRFLGSERLLAVGAGILVVHLGPIRHTRRTKHALAIIALPWLAYYFSADHAKELVIKLTHYFILCQLWKLSILQFYPSVSCLQRRSLLGNESFKLPFLRLGKICKPCIIIFTTANQVGKESLHHFFFISFFYL